MKIFKNQIEVDISKEVEILSSNDNGFDVEVIYKPDCGYDCINNYQIFHNCSEVHYLYETFLNNGKIAFESDFIHHTGCNRNIDEILMVKITETDHIYPEF